MNYKSFVLVSLCLLGLHCSSNADGFTTFVSQLAQTTSRYAMPALKTTLGGLMLAYAADRTLEVTHFVQSKNAHPAWKRLAKASLVVFVPLGIAGSVLLIKGINGFKCA